MDIWLYFDSRGIKQYQWETVWNECCEMLRCFPFPLAVYTDEKKWGYGRKVLSPKIIRGSGENRLIRFNSDMATYEHGGTFKLHHDIKKYRPLKGKQDILWIDEERIDEFSKNCRIWDENTRGAPYSLAVLAMGILLENRFPDNCYMYGFDYNDDQINNMCAWLAGALKTKISPPLCNDPERLWYRLVPLYKDINLVMQRFCLLSKISTRKSYEYLISQGCKDALKDELIRRLSSFSSVSQWESTDLLYPYLEATKDVEEVALMVKRVHEINGEEDFSLEELLTDLLLSGITINPLETEVAKSWNETGPHLVGEIERFNRQILRMGGAPQRIDFYASYDDLLEIFGCTEPENGVKFKEIIESHTEECKENYEKMEDFMDGLSSKIEELNDQEPAAIEAVEQWTRRSELPYEDYIIRQAEFQVKLFEDEVKDSLFAAKQIALSLNRFVADGEFRVVRSRIWALELLSLYSEHNEVSIRETTWEVIDNEQDIDILIMLLVYVSLVIPSEEDLQMRRNILEKPSLWKAMKEVFLEELNK